MTFIENFIKTELGNDLGRGLGIEHAHRAMAPKPPPSAPPRSVVVRFLQFSVKEKNPSRRLEKRAPCPKQTGVL